MPDDITALATAVLVSRDAEAAWAPVHTGPTGAVPPQAGRASLPSPASTPGAA